MNPNLREAVVHGSKDYPFAIYDIQNIKTIFQIALHWHEELEVIYVYQGPLYLTINNEAYIGHEGDIFIVNSKEIHDMHVEDTSVRYGALLFSLQFLLFSEKDFVTTKYLQPLCLGDISFHHHIEDKTLSKQIFTLITDALKLNKEKVPAYQLGTKALLLQIIALLFQHKVCTDNVSTEKNTTLNREILSYINERYTTSLTLGQIAEHFHMSYKYFSRYFKNTFHSTLSEYVMKLRLERTAMLLSTTELPVTEISLQTGFNNISFFIRCFKKTYGCSPLQYRHKHYTSRLI